MAAVDLGLIPHGQNQAQVFERSSPERPQCPPGFTQAGAGSLVGLLFAMAVLAAPLTAIVPAAATAPALLAVGFRLVEEWSAGARPPVADAVEKT